MNANGNILRFAKGCLNMVYARKRDSREKPIRVMNSIPHNDRIISIDDVMVLSVKKKILFKKY